MFNILNCVLFFSVFCSPNVMRFVTLVFKGRYIITFYLLYFTAAGNPTLQSKIHGQVVDLLESPMSLTIHGETAIRILKKSRKKLLFPTFRKVYDSSDSLQYLKMGENFWPSIQSRMQNI